MGKDYKLIKVMTSRKFASECVRDCGAAARSARIPAMARSTESNRINNEVLRKLWNDPDVRELTDSMKQIFPNEVGEDELIIDYDHLVEGGYVGEPPYFHLRLGRFLFYRATAVYEDYGYVSSYREEERTVYIPSSKKAD